MAEIRSREEHPIPGVAYSALHIPDEYNLGTGTFTTMVEAGAMAKINPIISNIMNEPYFLMIVTVNLGIDQVTALLGKAHDEGPISRKVFDIPGDINTGDAHDVTVVFRDWDIHDITLDGTSLKPAQ